MVPMLASLGCPYTCSFCIDSTVEYQPLGFDRLSEDLTFLLGKYKRPIIGWHDPNFGIRFDECMETLERTDPTTRIRHIAESSLSVLNESHLKRMQKNGFKAILPGVESWYDLGNKSKTRRTGLDKVTQVAEHVNLILRYIPYIQTNFVLGLDGDMGPEPFELTKKFLDLAPGAFPGYSLLSAFGRAAPLNLEYQRDERVLPFPHHFLNNNHAMNVKPKNYAWPEFYDRLIDLTTYSFSPSMIARRFFGNGEAIPRGMNVIRAMSSEGWGRIKYHKTIRGLLETDTSVRDYFEGESTVLPQFYRDRIRREAGAVLGFPARRGARARSQRVPQGVGRPGADRAAAGAGQCSGSRGHRDRRVGVSSEQQRPASHSRCRPCSFNPRSFRKGNPLPRQRCRDALDEWLAGDAVCRIVVGKYATVVHLAYWKREAVEAIQGKAEGV